MELVEQSAELVGLMFGIEPSSDGFELELSGPERLIEASGRVCYKSEDRITADSHKAFIKKLNKLQHHSVLEHSHASFRLVTDRGISHELVRHRLIAVSQESSRYVSYNKEKHGGGNIKFIIPEGLIPEQRDLFLEGYKASENLYNKAMDLGCSAQQARDLLPTGIKTELVISANFRQWLHMISLRTSQAAHPKVRTLMTMVHEKLKLAAPSVFDVEMGE